jgi:hypothetical protein
MMLRTSSVAKKLLLRSSNKQGGSALLTGTRALSSSDFSEVKEFPRPLNTHKTGIDILHDPLWNKSLAFDMSERDRLGLRGLLPPAVRTKESQVKRTIEHIRRLPDDISKNLYLQDLHNRNETLYHRVLIEYVSPISLSLIATSSHSTIVSFSID